MTTRYKKKKLKDFMQLVFGKKARTSSATDMIDRISVTVVCEAPDGNCPALRSCSTHNWADLPKVYWNQVMFCRAQVMFCRSQLRKWYGLSETEKD
jgi:hypothetical protein